LNFFSLFKRKILYKLKKKINIDNDSINFKTLDELLYFYGSDKSNIFKKNNLSGHGFSKFYSYHLNNLKKKKIRILEIGSFSGASAAAFSKYFDQSTIFCFDINISNFVYSSKNIHVFGLDINNINSVNKALKKIKSLSKVEMFDVIVDDGSHYLSDILFSLKTFFKLVNKGGFYIIEDYKHPNYYQYNFNIDDILVDKLLSHLKTREFFKSNLIKRSEQAFLIENIKDINIHKGSLKDSDICFIERK